ncbi:MAG: hypothetical protein C0502_11970, partial [Opitutus sp.]|nr:hypothetical protein [Opitutus sp.]
MREKLRSRVLWPLEIRPVAPPRKLARLTIPVGDFVPLLHQLEMLLRAGVTADQALRQLADDAPEGNARTLLECVHEQVAQGRPIHEACRLFAKQFPPHLAAVVAAGE